MTNLSDLIERVEAAGVTCATCQHIGVIYWDDGYRKTHHCMRSSDRRRDNFRSSGDAADDFMSEFRKFYDASASQPACGYFAERDPVGADVIALLAAVEAAGREGYVAAFFSPENAACTKMSGKFVDGGSHAYPNEPARGERRWFLTAVGKAEIERATSLRALQEKDHPHA